MHDHAVFIKAISVSCGQAVPVGLLNDIFICFLGCLVGLAVFTEVVVVDLAVIPDHALEAGFFLDDAAVQPIGVRADIVNAVDVLLEHAVRVKDAACFLCCTLWRQPADARGSIAGIGVKIIGLAVNFCPAGLLQLAVLVILPSKLVCEPAVPDLPLCIERHVACQLQNGAFVSIGGSAAVRRSVPAGELVVLARECIRVQRGIDADLKGLRRHLARTAIGVEGNRVEHTGCRRILRRISGIIFGSNDLRAPAGEGVAVVLVRCLICAARKGGHRALQAVLLRDDHAIDHPGDVCAGLGNFCALFDQLAADGAVFVAGIAGRRERRLDRIADLLGVTLCGDHFLRNKDLVADGAVLALGLAGFGAGRCNRRVDDLGVALCGDLLLRSDDLVADGAVLALGLAGLGAGRLHRRVDDLGMALCGNLLLHNDDLIADGAVLALGLARLGAGRCNRRVDHLSMPRCRDLFHAGEDCRTNGALRTGRMTRLGAGSGLFRNVNRGMPGCIDCFGLGCIANCAGVGLDTGVLTGRRGRDLALIPLVAGRRDLGLRSDHHAADGAADAVRQAGLGAGRRLTRHDLLRVTLGGDFLLRNDDCVADGAVPALGLAGLGAGRLHRRIDDLGVTLCRDHFALGDLLAADGADGVAGIAVLGAGGVRLIDHLCERMVVLPLGVEGGIRRQIDGRAIRIGVASTVSRRIPFQEVVAFTGKRVCVQCGIRLCIYGLWSHRALDRVFLAAVGVKGDRQLSGFLAAPYAVDIADNIASACGRSFRVGAVGVVQPGGCDGDVVACRAAVILIRLGFRTGRALLVVDAGALARADVRAAGGGVDAADGGQRAVDVHLDIRQRCAGACPSGGIDHGNELLAIAAAVAAPLIHVVDVDALTAGHQQLCAAGNGGLHAGQQRRRLVDGQLAAAGQVDGHVVGQRQNIVRGADFHAS